MWNGCNFFTPWTKREKHLLPAVILYLLVFIFTNISSSLVLECTCQIFTSTWVRGASYHFRYYFSCFYPSKVAIFSLLFPATIFLGTALHIYTHQPVHWTDVSVGAKERKIVYYKLQLFKSLDFWISYS